MSENVLTKGSEREADTYGILALAYMGDAVMELFARDRVLHEGKETKPGGLVRETKA